MSIIKLSILLLSLSALSIASSPPPSPSALSSPDEASSSQPNYTKKEATKVLRNSVKKWNRNDVKWDDLMHRKDGNLNVKLADQLEDNIKKQKDKISHVMQNRQTDHTSASKNQERRFKNAEIKAEKKMDQFTNDQIRRTLVRHAKTGESSFNG
ncbi:uncharacterized protein FA14DRAFT_156043 [Meira miltonrushii]|uniref:Uncharacterized protein n=1 Tax=Meira miltonrushii TaxID=1280837 RepID=A0A316V8J6_9BASI|nr:uncharacterized protein FA14DRAFT_156043 [Meira miltonrushii]PWN33348.1 hypothetical protein FA14DRAFT_156043 [Meira miltonrushii]